MRILLISALIILISALHVIQAARLARNCNNKFAGHLRCYKDNVGRASERDSSFPVPSDSEKRRLDGAVNNCFTNQFHCSSSPVPTSQQSKDRLDCFNQVKNSLRGQLQQCVKRSVEDFNLPDDPYDPTTDWSYRVLSIQNSFKLFQFPKFCSGNVDKRGVQNCVNNLGYDFNRRVPNKAPPYVCQVDADCWNNWGYDCQNTWEYQIVPQLCQCSQDMQRQKAVKSAQDQYKSCLSGRGQTLAKDDPVLKWIDNYLRGQCTTAQNNPCRREREDASRRSASQRSG